MKFTKNTYKFAYIRESNFHASFLSLYIWHQTFLLISTSLFSFTWPPRRGPYLAGVRSDVPTYTGIILTTSKYIWFKSSPSQTSPFLHFGFFRRLPFHSWTIPQTPIPFMNYSADSHSNYELFPRLPFQLWTIPQTPIPIMNYSADSHSNYELFRTLPFHTWTIFPLIFRQTWLIFSPLPVEFPVRTALGPSIGHSYTIFFNTC